MINKPMSELTRGLECVVGLVLCFAGTMKLYNPAAFLDAVYGYELVGPHVGMLVAALIPSAEVVLGAALIVGASRRTASLCALLLALIFVVAQAMAIRAGVTAPCGCVTLGEPEPLGPATLVRASIFASICLVVSILNYFQKDTYA